MWIIELLNDYSGLLSLLATIILSVLIYCLERHHEKRAAMATERMRHEAISEQAKVFVIDNYEEKDYLPLCVVAASVKRYAKHKRKIYTHFSKCSSELQAEILRQENIPIAVTKDDEWVDEYVEKMRKDAEQHQLGRDLLYDGAKYFHRGFERYADHKIDISTRVFPLPQSDTPFRQMLGPHYKGDYTRYIDYYLEFVLRDREDTKDHPELLPQIPPYDFVYSNQNWGSCPEPISCFWAMQTIRSTSIAFSGHGIVGQDKAEWRDLTSGDAEIETFEDLYYEALLALYTAYAPKAIL